MPKGNSTMKATIYCQYTNYPLYQVDPIFPNEQLHYTKHPIFTKRYDALTKLHTQTDKTNRTHAQRTLLALSHIMHQDTGRILISLASPVSFDELTLKRCYTTIVMLSNKIARLPTKEKKDILIHLPKFNSKAISCEYPTGSESHMAVIGNGLLNYISNVLPIALENAVSDCGYHHLTGYSAEELALLSASARSDMRTTGNKAGITEYWAYIFEEIESCYGISTTEIGLLAKQLSNPTDDVALNELQIYVTGLQNMAASGNIPSIPAIQFKNAIREIIGIRAKLHHTANQPIVLDFGDDTPLVPVQVDFAAPRGTNKATVAVELVTDQQVANQQAIDPTPSPMQANSNRRPLNGFLQDRLARINQLSTVISTTTTNKAEARILAARELVAVASKTEETEE